MAKSCCACATTCLWRRARAPITQVRSHPQALAQCESYLNRHKYAAVPWYDTAGSAKDLAAARWPGVGVIASKLAAQVYGLEIVDEGIEDMPNNYTRFFVVGRGATRRAPPLQDLAGLCCAQHARLALSCAG
jgi:prephenate dehydratase